MCCGSRCSDGSLNVRTNGAECVPARVEPKNAPQESEKTDNFKTLVFRQFQPGVDTRVRLELGNARAIPPPRGGTWGGTKDLAAKGRDWGASKWLVVRQEVSGTSG